MSAVTAPKPVQRERPAPARRHVASAVAPLRRLPRAFWLCVLLGIANACVWAVVTPSFQVPDETVHVGYVQYLGETGRPPRPVPGLDPTPDGAAPDLVTAWNDMHFSITNRPTWSRRQEQAMRHALDAPFKRKSEAGAEFASNNPPLYYALETIPYRIAHAGNPFDRLLAMRLFSSLFAGLIVGFVFLFLRELLPRSPWAWTVGALAVAFQPMIGFMSGGVNPDGLLYAAGAAAVWLVARSFRLGLTPRRGAALGLALAAGALTKSTMFGLLPGVLVALAFLVWRAPRSERRRALAAAAAAVALAAVPVLAWYLSASALLERPTGTATGGVGALPSHGIREQLSYVWQFYLPRLPFMTDQFKGYPSYPLWQTYFQGFVGRFGWFEWGFPGWFYWVALAVYVPLLGLAIRALGRARSVLRTRWPEFLSYVAIAGGLAAMLAYIGYRYRNETNTDFEQARYLLPLIALYGGFVAVAVRGAGRRFAPAVGAVFVVLVIGSDVAAQLLSFARYYS